MKDELDRLVILVIESIYIELEPVIANLKRIKKVIYWSFQIALNLVILIYLFS